MSARRWFMASLVAAIAAGALGFASRAPYSPADADAALLRLSWRLRGQKLESCRTRTADELAALPAHMRTPRICTNKLVSYRLVVRLDDARADTVTFVPAGAKGDRPIFVLHDTPLDPGRHDVDIEFAPIDVDDSHDWKPLRYRGLINARRGRIELITLSSDAASLVLRERQSQ